MPLLFAYIKTRFYDNMWHIMLSTAKDELGDFRNLGFSCVDDTEFLHFRYGLFRRKIPGMCML